MGQQMEKWRTSRLGGALRRYITPPVLATILLALLATWVLFIPPYNGYANNGDFERSMYVSGLYVLPTRPYNHFNYFVRQFGIMQYFNESAATLFSSQPLIIKAAIGLNRLFYSSKIFDIRFLGLLYTVTYLGAIYLLTDALTFRLQGWRRYAMALLIVFIFGDGSLLLYFNSFFAEPAMLISFVYLFACTVLLARRRWRHVWPLYLLFGFNAVIFITVKQQNAPLAVIIAFIFLSFIFLHKTRGAKLFVVLGAVAIVGTGVLTYAKITTDFNDINQYQSMTRGVLLNAKDPGQSLQAGGINRQYALLRGLPYFETYMPEDLHGATLKKNLLTKYDFVWILRYYLTHMDQFVELLDLAARDTQIVQIEAVGDYERSAGKPPIAQTRFFTGYSLLKKTFYPRVFSFYLLLLVVLFGLYCYSAYQDLRAHQAENVVRLALVLACTGMIIAVCLISIIGDGDADLAKHLFMAPLAVDLLTVLLVSDILGRQLFHRFTPVATPTTKVSAQKIAVPATPVKTVPALPLASTPAPVQKATVISAPIGNSPLPSALIARLDQAAHSEAATAQRRPSLQLPRAEKPKLPAGGESHEQ